MLAERLFKLNSIMTGRGMIIVQQTSMTWRQEIIDKDERSMLVSTTRTVYPGMIDNGTRESMSFFDGRAPGRRWGGDELIAAFPWPIEGDSLTSLRQKKMSYPVLPTKKQLTFKILTSSE